VGTVLDRFGFDGDDWIMMLKKIQIVDTKLKELLHEENEV